jgi:hypothetical protein
MGSLQRALLAAFGAAAILGLLWIAFSYLTGFQLSIFAAIYGIVVSFCTVHFSKGCGPLYQAVATTATILGLLVSDTVVMIAISSPDGFLHVLRMTTSEWQAALGHFLNNDPVTAIFMVLGVIGGFYIWRPS